LGWVLLRLNEATHLVYRPRRYVLPDGKIVDSTGSEWAVDNDGENVIMEKVAVSLVDDLTIGDAVNFFTIHEAPYRPYITYRAHCAMEGALISGPPTTVRPESAEPMGTESPSQERASGRLGRMATRPSKKNQMGPQGHDIRPVADENNHESEE
jgi:hypothetical protein